MQRQGPAASLTEPAQEGPQFVQHIFLVAEKGINELHLVRGWVAPRRRLLSRHNNPVCFSQSSNTNDDEYRKAFRDRHIRVGELSISRTLIYRNPSINVSKLAGSLLRDAEVALIPLVAHNSFPDPGNHAFAVIQKVEMRRVWFEWQGSRKFKLDWMVTIGRTDSLEDRGVLSVVAMTSQFLDFQNLDRLFESLWRLRLFLPEAV